MNDPSIPAAFESGRAVSYYTALGLMTASWAYVELYLDLMIALIHGLAGGNAIEAKIPRTFGNKITVLKKYFSRLPSLDEHKQKARGLFTRAKELSQKRHFLIHGVSLGFASEQPEYKRLIRMVAKESWHETEGWRASASDIANLTGECLTLALELSSLAGELRLGDVPLHHSERS